MSAMKTDSFPPAAPAAGGGRPGAWGAAGAVAAAAGAGAVLGLLGDAALASLPGAQAWSGSAIGAAVAALLASVALWRSRRHGAAAVPAMPDAQRAVRDPLTGAYDQPHFVAAADREWARLRRRGEDAALLMVDIDRFDRLAETHGPALGDALLDEVTRQAVSTLRPYDLLARFGGGVLVVYLPHTDPIGALDVAERIRERVAALRLSQDGKTVTATVSIGVAPIGEAHGTLDAVITDAGVALRDAKAAGRNCVRSTPIPPRRSPASGTTPDRRRA